MAAAESPRRSRATRSSARSSTAEPGTTSRSGRSTGSATSFWERRTTTPRSRFSRRTPPSSPGPPTRGTAWRKATSPPETRPRPPQTTERPWPSTRSSPTPWRSSRQSRKNSPSSPGGQTSWGQVYILHYSREAAARLAKGLVGIVYNIDLTPRRGWPGLGGRGNGVAPVVRALPLSVDEVAAAAGADREGFPRELPAEPPCFLPGPDLAEGLLADVANEVVREVAAEADLSVRLDLGEVPGHGAEVVAEGLGEVREVFRHALGRHVRDERGPRPPERRVEEPPALQPLQEPHELPHLALARDRQVRCVEVEPLPGRRLDAEGRPHDALVLRADRLRDEPAKPDVDRVERQLLERLDRLADLLEVQLRDRQDRDLHRQDLPELLSPVRHRPHSRHRLLPCALLPANAVVHVGRPVDGDRDGVHPGLDQLPRVLLEPAAVGDDRAGQAALLDLADQRDDVGIEKRLSPEEAHDRLVRRDLVEQPHVVGQRELALGPDQLPDAHPLLLAVGSRGREPVGAVDSGVAPLPAHLAAQVAEVRHAQLQERRHRQVRGARVFQVGHDLAPPPAHPPEVAAREAGQPESPRKAHRAFPEPRVPARFRPVVKSTTRAIARRQTTQNGTSSRENMMQSACGR